MGWVLWNNRNGCFFDNFCKLHKTICASIFVLADDYRKAQGRSMEATVRPVHNWVAPIIDYYKINMDESFKVEEFKA